MCVYLFTANKGSCIFPSMKRRKRKKEGGKKSGNSYLGKQASLSSTLYEYYVGP